MEGDGGATITFSLIPCSVVPSRFSINIDCISIPSSSILDAGLGLRLEKAPFLKVEPFSSHISSEYSCRNAHKVTIETQLDIPNKKGGGEGDM